MAIAHPKHWQRLLRSRWAETTRTDWKWLIPKIIDDTFSTAKRYDILGDSRALSFTFILSLVPLLAIAFTFFKLFGGLTLFLENTLKPLLSRNFPTSVAAQLNAFIDSFVGNMQTGTLGVVSFATLLATVLALMMNIEGSFNRIFEAKMHRSLLRRIGSYWVMLSATPLVIVLSTAKSSEIMNTLKPSLGILSQFGLLDLIRYAVGHLVQIVGFGALFVILPERKPRFHAVFWGALTTHLIFQLLATINVHYASFVFSNRTNLQLYGSLPLLVLVFLIWVRLVWLGILFGACLCSEVDKHLETRQHNHQSEPWSFPAETVVNCVRLLDFHIETFRRQSKPQSPTDIGHALNIPPNELELHHERLVRKGLLIPLKFADKECFSPTISALGCHENPEKLLSDLMDIPSGQFPGQSVGQPSSGLVADVERSLLSLRKD